MSKMKAWLLAGAVAFIVITVKATQKAGTESANGLRMSLAHDQGASGPDKTTHFTVTFSNLRSEDLTFSPGTLVLCGETPSKTSAVKLNLTDAQGKQHRHLPYLGDGPPYHAGCAGKIEFYVVVCSPSWRIPVPSVGHWQICGFI